MLTILELIQELVFYFLTFRATFLYEKIFLNSYL